MKLHSRGAIQGGLITAVAFAITRMVLGKPLSLEGAATGFAGGLVVTWGIILLARWGGQQGVDNPESFAWLAFLTVIATGVLLGMFDR